MKSVISFHQRRRSSSSSTNLQLWRSGTFLERKEPVFERCFRLSENQTSFRTKILACVTIFLKMAYIIAVQPAVLSGAMFGMNT
jgi:hypothetical protein